MMDLSHLLQDVLKFSEEPENKKKKERLNRLYAHERKASPLVFIRPTRPYLCRKYGLDIQTIYQEPKEYLQIELLCKAHSYQEFNDDTPVWPLIEIWLGVPFEMSLLGTSWSIKPNSDPWVGPPVLQKIDDVLQLKWPDFKNTGMMPLAHRMHRELKKLVDNKLDIWFPQWQKGTLGIAMGVRGDRDFYIDFFDNPHGVHQLMGYIDRVGVWYEETRNRIFEVSKKDGRWGYRRYRTLGNDEVDCSVISPAHYRQFIYAYDLRYTQRAKDGVYLHSCGNLSPIYKEIDKLPNLKILHISPWSDFDLALEMTDQSIILEKAFHQHDRYFQMDSNKMKEEIDKLVRAAKEKGRLFYFLADADISGEEEDKRLLEWLEICRESIRNYYP
ncbi:MAG: hypothetical protein AB1798_05710 [Spirochaetota bacterium]